MNEVNNNKQNDIKQIDFCMIAQIIRENKRLYLVTLPITFVVACLLIICIPRYYKCEVTLAPELSNSSNINSIATIAGSFGIDLSKGLAAEDAISPALYPDLMSSTDFVVSIFPIEITTKEGETYTYYDYLKSHQKTPWWTKAIRYVKSIFKEEETDGLKGKINPFRLTKEQQGIANLLNRKLSCTVDKKTDVISILVEDQDPLVCATIADSARVRLQEFITKYRTNKARNDLRQTKELHKEAKKEYEKARGAYSSFADRNNDLVLESYRSRREELENEMQLRYNIYSNLTTQLQLAQAKVQERTPAFTTLKCATVPVRPAGPKRMVFVGAITLLAFVVITIYKYAKELQAS